MSKIPGVPSGPMPGGGTGDGGGERPHRYGRNGSSRPIESRQIPCDVWLRGVVDVHRFFG